MLAPMREGGGEGVGGQATDRRGMLVRGLKKVRAVALSRALSHNLATALRLRAERAAAAPA